MDHLYRKINWAPSGAVIGHPTMANPEFKNSKKKDNKIHCTILEKVIKWFRFLIKSICKIYGAQFLAYLENIQGTISVKQSRLI